MSVERYLLIIYLVSFNPKVSNFMEKTAMITGATAGIGEATAIRFAQNKFKLIITGRRADRLQNLANLLTADHGVEVLPLCFDVRDQAAVEHQLKTVPEG